MIQEKRLRLAVLLLQGLSIDEAAELTTLLKEERQEWFDREVKKLNTPDVVGRSEQLVCDECGKDKPENLNYCDCYEGVTWIKKQTN